jgi:hypothetical protein
VYRNHSSGPLPRQCAPEHQRVRGSRRQTPGCGLERAQLACVSPSPAPPRYRVGSIMVTPPGTGRHSRPGGGRNGSRRRSQAGSQAQESGRGTMCGPSRTKTCPFRSSTAMPLAATPTGGVTGSVRRSAPVRASSMLTLLIVPGRPPARTTTRPVRSSTTTRPGLSPRTPRARPLRYVHRAR